MIKSSPSWAASKYCCLRFKEWWVDSDVIAHGSADQAMEGKHYYRSLRLHK